MISYDQLTDQILQHYTSKDFEVDVAHAKTAFFEGTGFLDEESDDFEMKMIQFGDWYVFTRMLDKVHLRPVDYVVEDKIGLKISDEELVYIKNMQACRHTIFEFIKFSGDDLKIKDLFSNYKMTIKNTHLKFGFNKGDIFEARIIPHDDTFCFARGFCFHPVEAKKFILKRIKDVKDLPEGDQKAAREKLIFKLFKMKYKYEQYAHVAPEKIYTDSISLR